MSEHVVGSPPVSQDRLLQSTRRYKTDSPSVSTYARRNGEKKVKFVLKREKE